MKILHRAYRRGHRLARGALLVLAATALAMPAAQTARALPADTGTQPESGATRAPLLDLYRGEIRMLPIAGAIKRIAIGDGALLSANVVDGNMMLLAEKPGITSLIVWTDRGIVLQRTVRIARANVNETADQLRSVLETIPGLSVLAKGPNIVLSGTVHRDMRERIKAAVNGVPNVIDATTTDEGEALKKTLHFKVQIMELTRNAQERLGIAWDTQIAGPHVGTRLEAGNAAQHPSTFVAGLATNLTSRINLAISDGDAYLLAAPELNTKSGGTASFLAGGQVPIPRAGALGTTDVEYKDYGVKLMIKPVVDANNIISATIETEISQIDPSVEYGGYPGFLSRKASSDISLRAGETMAISGLINADAIGNTSRLPFLGRLPILGRLFRSDAFQSKKSDLVIFVTPLISDPTQTTNAGLLERANRIDTRFRARYGDPLPQTQDGKPAPGAAGPSVIAPTPPQPIGPTRITPAPARPRAGIAGPAAGSHAPEAPPASVPSRPVLSGQPVPWHPRKPHAPDAVPPATRDSSS